MTPSTFSANWLSMTTLITEAVLGDGVITSCRITSKSRDEWSHELPVHWLIGTIQRKTEVKAAEQIANLMCSL